MYFNGKLNRTILKSYEARRGREGFRFLKKYEIMSAVRATSRQKLSERREFVPIKTASLRSEKERGRTHTRVLELLPDALTLRRRARIIHSVFARLKKGHAIHLLFLVVLFITKMSVLKRNNNCAMLKKKKINNSEAKRSIPSGRAMLVINNNTRDKIQNPSALIYSAIPLLFAATRKTKHAHSIQDALASSFVPRRRDRDLLQPSVRHPRSRELDLLKGRGVTRPDATRQASSAA